MVKYRTACPTCNGNGYVEQDNIVVAPIITTHNSDVDEILRSALGQMSKVVVILGCDTDGDQYFASNVADGADALWHMQRGIHKLMQMVDKPEED